MPQPSRYIKTIIHRLEGNHKKEENLSPVD
jgi:hypothetical protein